MLTTVLANTEVKYFSDKTYGTKIDLNQLCVDPYICS